MKILVNKALLIALFAFTMIMSFTDCRAEWGQCSFGPPGGDGFQPQPYYPMGDFGGGSCCPAPCAVPCGSPCGAPSAYPCGTPSAYPCGTPSAYPCGTPSAYPCGTPCCPAPCAPPCYEPPCSSYANSDNYYNGYDYGYGNGNGYGYDGGYGNSGWGNRGWGSGRGSGGPLCPCRFSITARGGVAPGIICNQQKGKIRNFVGIGEASVVGTAPPVLTLDETVIVQTDQKKAPDFSDQFCTPWTAGGEIAFSLSCNTEVFLDGNYLSASGRTNNYSVIFPMVDGTLFPTTVVLPTESVRIREKFSRLKTYDGYLGFRYYFPRCCGVSLFFGGKAGFRHWEEISACVSSETTFINSAGVTQTKVLTFGKHHYYPSQWVVSGGFQAGLNFCLCRCLQIVFLAEAVASGTFRFGESQTANNIISTTGAGTLSETMTQTILEVPVRRFGTIFVFPVTLGLRYTF